MYFESDRRSSQNKGPAEQRTVESETVWPDDEIKVAQFFFKKYCPKSIHNSFDLISDVFLPKWSKNIRYLGYFLNLLINFVTKTFQNKLNLVTLVVGYQADETLGNH